MEKYYMGDKFTLGGEKYVLARTIIKGNKRQFQFQLISTETGNRWSDNVIIITPSERGDNGSLWIYEEELDFLLRGESKWGFEFSPERRNY